MSFRPGCGFRIVGHVVRKFVSPTGKIAFLTLAVPGDKGERKHDLRTFSLVGEVGALGVGMTVEALGTIDTEKLTAKDRSDVKVDGREVWVEKLTIRTLNIEGSSKPAAKQAELPTPGGPLPGDPVESW